MSRFLALVLTVAFSFPLISPALLAAEAAAAKSESQLPACCRRDGKHRCSMPASAMAVKKAATTPVRLASPDHCPLYPSGMATAPSNARLAAHSPAHVSPVAASAADPGTSAAQAEALYRQSYSRTSQKRGPPHA